jgi:hypothetical protein
VNKLLCIVVNNLFRYAIALDICEQGCERIATYILRIITMLGRYW